MKFLKKVCLGIFILLILIVISVIIALKTIDINQYKDKITQYASNQIGREIQVENISYNISFKKGLLIILQDFRVGNIEETVDYAVISEAVALNVDLLSFLLSREINVNKVKIKKATFKFVTKEDDAPVDIQHQGVIKDQSKIKNIPTIEDVLGQGAINQLYDTQIKEINLYNCKLIIQNQVDGNAEIINVDDIDLNIRNIKINQPINLILKAAIFSENQNVNVKSDIIITEDDYLLNDFRLDTNLGYLSLNRINEVFPLKQFIDISRKSSGMLNLRLKEVSISDTLQKINGKLVVTDGQIKLNQIHQVLDNIDLNVQFNEDEISIEEFFLYLFNGRLANKGEIKNYLASPQFNIQTTFEDLSLAEMLEQYKLPIEFQGRVFGQSSQKGSGQAVDQLIDSLRGNVNVRIEDGKIVDVNLLQLIMKKLEFIPGVTDILDKKLSRHNKERLELKDTHFEKLSFNVKINKNDIIVDELIAQTEEFTFDLTAQFDKKLFGKIQSRLIVSKPLSIDMVASVPELKYLQNKEESIEIQMNDYEGSILEYRPNPLNVDIPIQVIRGKVEDEARKAIRKYLKIPGESQTENNPDAPVDNSTSPPQKEAPQEKGSESLEDALIGGALEMIFGN